jgi:phage-related protein
VADGLKPLYWIAGSRKDLSAFPEEVKDVMGFALHSAQAGTKSAAAKPLTGFGGAGVLEIVDDYDGNTYRAIYTVKFGDAVYVLHAFQKKAKRGIKTPAHEIDVIKDRLRTAEAYHKAQGGRR